MKVKAVFTEQEIGLCLVLIRSLIECTGEDLQEAKGRSEIVDLLRISAELEKFEEKLLNLLDNFDEDSSDENIIY